MQIQLKFWLLGGYFITPAIKPILPSISALTTRAVAAVYRTPTYLAGNFGRVQKYIMCLRDQIIPLADQAHGRSSHCELAAWILIIHFFYARRHVLLLCYDVILLQSSMRLGAQAARSLWGSQPPLVDAWSVDGGHAALCHLQLLWLKGIPIPRFYFIPKCVYI